MSTFDDEHGLPSAPACPVCGYPGCMRGKGCDKRRREKRHRDEVAALRAEVEHWKRAGIDAQREVVAENERLGAEVERLTRERDEARSEAERDALRARVAEMEAFVALLQTAKEQAEHAHNELALSLPERLRAVAERQREACAMEFGNHDEHVGSGRYSGFEAAQRVRATPLVTEGGK